jgi:hypothetical protein
MDSGKVFVLIVTVVAVGVLVYLELKSRQSRRDAESSSSAANDDMPRKTSGGSS